MDKSNEILIVIGVWTNTKSHTLVGIKSNGSVILSTSEMKTSLTSPQHKFQTCDFYQSGNQKYDPMLITL